MKPKDHVTVLGALHIAWSALLLTGAAAVLIVLVFGGLISEDEHVTFLLASVGILASSLMFIFAMVGIVSAVGLFRQRRWARYVLMVLGAV